MSPSCANLAAISPAVAVPFTMMRSARSRWSSLFSRVSISRVPLTVFARTLSGSMTKPSSGSIMDEIAGLGNWQRDRGFPVPRTLERLRRRQEALGELLPQLLARLAAEHIRRLGIADQPVAALDLRRELARHPADEAGEVARVVGRLLDDAVDALAVRRHVDVAEQVERRLARIAAQQREQRVGRL